MPDSGVYDGGALFQLRSAMSWDAFEAFQELLVAHDIHLTEFYPEALVQAELLRQIRTRGVAAILATVQLEESLMSPTHDVEPILTLLSEMVADLHASDRIDLIDPYALTLTRGQLATDQAERIFKVVSPGLAQAHSIRIVHDPTKVSPGVVEELQGRLARLDPEVNLTLHPDTNFHDRFVLADGTRGIVVGCSLNGIGKKYALLDKLQDEDALAIATAIAD